MPSDCARGPGWLPDLGAVMTLHISVSQINAEVGCPRERWYDKVEKIPRESKPSAYPQGSAGHKALEYFYANYDGTIPDDPYELAAVVQQALETDDTFTSIPVIYPYIKKSATNKREGYKEMEMQTYMLIKAFWQNPYMPAEVIDTEHKFTIQTPGGVDVIGYIDLIARDEDGTICIVDHKFIAKSSGTLKTFDGEGLTDDDDWPTVDTGMIEQLTPQMMIYGLYGTLTYGDPNVRLFHQEIVKNKKPVCRLLEFHRPPNYQQEVMELIDAMIDRIMNATKKSSPRIRSWRCGGCGWSTTCANDF